MAMAVAVEPLTMRTRARGTEVSVLVNGREFVFWHRGPDAPTSAWVQAAYLARKAAEDQAAADLVVEETTLGAQAFFTWLYRRRQDKRLRRLLRPAFEVYELEVLDG